MKKKILLFLLALTLVVPVISSPIQEVRAETNVALADIDYSYLEHEDALVGYLQSQTRGVYLSFGTSAIRKYSSTQIAAGGTTEATKTCKVSITAIVERYKSGGWARVTSWAVTKASGTNVIASKVLSVTTGYKYRVRCYHYAGTDSGSSYTSALQM